jgi:TPP-dependent pyruvate/acetoin dehydrogenase alpha subunit
LGIRAVRVDGFDTKAVHAAVVDAVETARGQCVPVFVESVTYRLRPHAFGTDESYVPQDAREQALTRDPVPVFRAELAADGTLTESELDAIDTEVADEVADALAYAESAAPTDASEMTKDVFANDEEQITS